MANIVIQPSNKKGKRYDAVIDGKKTVSFGASGYSDFTKHRDEDRKKNYIARHKPNQNWKDHTTAGFFAKNILWNKPTIKASISDANARVLRVTNRKFPDLNIKLKKNQIKINFNDLYLALVLHPRHHASQFSI